MGITAHELHDRGHTWVEARALLDEVDIDLDDQINFDEYSLGAGLIPEGT